ncbi:AAA family ATPase [Croceibacterium sp. TMG7-5b_MA50]|uniref:AAA family ATPase n=1 Tax=Croceibacterium sp. TMG7-5b_MA50 TaxID=3121290 RepID=UPI0032221038
MRILAIRGSNLASLAGEWALDFEQGALADAGIFAITGPTGAGKSTLLDAMSLALFDTVPRLSGAPAQGTVADLNPRDARAILRHGAAEGFAEIDFAGRDGRHYRSRWSVKRARGKADGRLQQSDLALHCLHSGERLGGKKVETKAEIVRLLGLNADQFGRAVVLAQGEFEAFIKASGDERAQLLERLTGADIYTRLGQAAFARARQEREAQAAIEARIAAQQGLSDEERTVLEGEFVAAGQAHDAAASAHAALQAIRDWHDRLAQLAALEEEAGEQHRAALTRQADAAQRRDALARRRRAYAHAPAWQHLAHSAAQQREAAAALDRLMAEEAQAGSALAVAEADHRTAHTLLADAQAAERAAAPLLEQARAADRALAAAGEQVSQAAAALAGRRQANADAQHAAGAAQRAFADAQKRLAELTDWQRDHAPLERLARQERELLGDLAVHGDSHARIMALETTQADAQAGLRHAQREREGADAMLAEAQAARAAAVEALSVAEGALPPSARMAALDDERDALLAAERCHLAATHAAGRVTEAQGMLADLAGRIDAAAALQDAGEQERSGLVAAQPALSARADEAAQAAERASLTASDAAARLRAALVDGAPCPVCGAVEHPLQALDAVLDDAVTAARDRATKLAEEREEARLRLAVLDSQLAGTARDLEEWRRQHAVAGQRHTASLSDQQGAAQALANALSAVGLADDPALPAVIASRLTTLTAERTEGAQAAEAARQARTAEREAGIAHDAARDRQARAAAAEQTARDALMQAERPLVDATAEQRRLGGALDTLLAPLGDWRAMDDAPGWLAALAAQWRTAAQEHAALTAALPGHAAASAAAGRDAANAARDLSTAEHAHAEASGHRTRLAADRAALLGGEAADAVAARIAGASANAAQAERSAAATLAEAQTRATAARTRVEEGRRTLSAAERDHVDREERLDAALAADGLTRNEVTAVAETGEAALVAEGEALAALDRAVAAAATMLDARRGDLAQHRQAAPAQDTADLPTRLADAAGALQAAETARSDLDYRLRRDDEVRAATAQLRAELSAAREAGRVWEQVDTLIGDREGKRFRNWAQGLTLDRLLDAANHRLADLKGRYQLLRGDGGDMLIEVVDIAMGGQRRGLQNLSGGERFLVSLALALGLAEMSTGRGVRIESLFIDEGFGALDSASLGQAIGVLEQLHGEGRRVGIISHVEELKERIPVKVVVTPASGGCSTLAVMVD